MTRAAAITACALLVTAFFVFAVARAADYQRSHCETFEDGSAICHVDR